MTKWMDGWMDGKGERLTILLETPAPWSKDIMQGPLACRVRVDGLKDKKKGLLCQWKTNVLYLCKFSNQSDSFLIISLSIGVEIGYFLKELLYLIICG